MAKRPGQASAEQKRGLLWMRQAARSAFGATTEPCDQAIDTLVGAGITFGRGDRMVQPVDPARQPSLLEEWKQIGADFSEARRKVVDRCGRKR